MNAFQFLHILIVLTFFSSFVVHGQETRNPKKDTLRTENVTVIKTFNPTINDAFKIETPVNEGGFSKEPVEVSKFRIQSVPVASTFVPKKAKSVKVKKERRKLPPQNYVSLGAGNFGNAEAEAFVSYPVGKDAKFSALLEHQSSQGGIDDVRVDDFFYDTGLQLFYDKQDRKTPWGLFFEAQHQLYNWYGIPEDFALTDAQLVDIDPAHTFMDFNIGGDITFDNNTFKGLTSQLRYFFDDYSNSEINFLAQPNFKIAVSDYTINFPVVLDALLGSFNQEEFLVEADYQIINVGVKPSVNLSFNDIDFRLGVSAFVSADTENSDTDFFIYPNVLATYQFKDYGISVFGGLTGELKQNTYHNASAANPFVTPLLGLTPTSEQFNLYGGLQGSINSKLTYEVKGSYTSEVDKPLFQSFGNASLIGGLTTPNYAYSNSFAYVYADVNTGSLSGNLNYTVADVYNVSLSASFFVYDTEGQLEAWNLPKVTTTLRGSYQVNEKLNLETSIFFIGTRKDFDTQSNESVDVESIFDVNFGASYSFIKNWQAFLKGKNVTNQSYERWLDYPVQSAQALVGVRYLFE